MASILDRLGALQSSPEGAAGRSPARALWPPPTSLRLRLALWYAALLALILGATSYLSYSFHSTSHYDDADRSLAGLALRLRDGLGASGAQAVQQGATLPVPPLDEHASPEVYVRLYDGAGRVVASSANAGTEPEADPGLVASAPRDAEGGSLTDRLMRSLIHAARPGLPEEGGFFTIVEPENGRRTRLYALPVGSGGQLWGYLEAGTSLEQIDHSLNRLKMLLIFSSLGGLLAALFGGWAIAAGALRPVAAMASTARTVALSRSFSQRLPELNRRDELGQLAETFNEMLASLDEAYRNQQRFIADASHELRAPLTTIQGNLELLERAPDLSEAERAEALAYVRQEVRRMGRLIADLLVLARADAGQPLRARPVELDRVLLEVFGENMARAGDRKLHLEGLEQVAVQGDRDRLKQLLLILVDNALKYTPAGGEIRLSLHTEAGLAVTTVSDTGIGIAAEDLPHIFERFYRADKARSRDQGGTGLGLSIARWIAERHGGSISVESAPGKGSSFKLRLPRL